MGWRHCGEDSGGRNIGYGVAAVCDHPGCSEPIDRGLGYACGGMHGTSEGCEGYFCGEHLSKYLADNLTGSIYGGRVCAACYDDFVADYGPICRECDGDGRVGMGGTKSCEACNGSGLTPKTDER